MVTEYRTIIANLEKQLKAVKSRNEYKKLALEQRHRLNQFLTRLETVIATEPPGNDNLEMVKGKIFLDLGKIPQAHYIFDFLIEKRSPLADEAKLHKVRLLIQEHRSHEAIPLFREVENTVPKDKHYLWIMLDFSFSAKDVKVREEFCRRFLAGAGDSKEFNHFKGMVRNNLATIVRQKGNLKEAVAILEKALKETEDPKTREELQAGLKQAQMHGKTAPEIKAEKWVNSDPLSLAGLKGKVVALDFWATWCRPCQKTIPDLIKIYQKHEHRGFVVIGFTRLYGGYSDDQGNKGKVSPEEERKLIEGFADRHQVPYPIAIADTPALFETYGVLGIPTLVLIDKKGKVTYVEMGAESNVADLEKRIENLLK